MNLQENIQRIKEMMDIDKEIKCENCDWSWDIKDTQPHDRYVCHKCGNDNSENYD